LLLWVGHAEVVKLLIANKADANARRSYGDKPPIDVVQRCRRLDIVELSE